MPRNKPSKPSKPKIKPAHSVAAKVGTRMRAREKDSLHEMLVERGNRIAASEESTLLRLRGDEMTRLHERLQRIEDSLAARWTAQDSARAELASWRVRNAELRVEWERRMDLLEGVLADRVTDKELRAMLRERDVSFSHLLARLDQLESRIGAIESTLFAFAETQIRQLARDTATPETSISTDLAEQNNPEATPESASGSDGVTTPDNA